MLEANPEKVIGLHRDSVGAGEMGDALRRADPKSLSDDDLAKACLATRAEDWLFAGGCLGSVIALVVVVLVSLIFDDAAAFVLMTSLSLLVAIFGAYRVLQRFKQPFREEFAYRSGKAAPSIYMDEAQAALENGQADWTVLFTALDLPHGGHNWLRLDLAEGAAPSGKADWRASSRSGAAAYKLRRGVMDLSGKKAADWLSILTALDLDTLTDVPGFVYDGTPCTLAVLRARPPAEVMARCNLAALSPEEALQHPTARICARLQAFAQRD